MEREIRLYGSLAKFIGQRKFMAEVASAGEAIRMLLANFPGLDVHMAENHYKVIVDDYESELEQINNPFSQSIKIIPIVGGAGGGGTGTILAGIGLIALAIITGGIASAGVALGGFMGIGTVGTIAVGIGAGLVFKGVAQMLTPTPQMGQIGAVAPATFNTTENTDLDPQKSYSFSGIQNTSQQGVPVPLIYGETFVGSVVISAGIDTDNI